MFERFRKSITGYTFTDGKYTDGKWEEGIESSFVFTSSVQPLQAREMESLPEERRNKTSYVLYSDKLMKTVEQNEHNPDIVEIDNERYEVFSRENWKNNVISHYRYIVIKLDNAENIEPEVNIVPLINVHYSMLRQLIPINTGGHGGQPAP